jgi:hypothetical protein
MIDIAEGPFATPVPLLLVIVLLLMYAFADNPDQSAPFAIPVPVLLLIVLVFTVKLPRFKTPPPSVPAVFCFMVV